LSQVPDRARAESPVKHPPKALDHMV